MDSAEDRVGVEGSTAAEEQSGGPAHAVVGVRLKLGGGVAGQDSVVVSPPRTVELRSPSGGSYMFDYCFSDSSPLCQQAVVKAFTLPVAHAVLEGRNVSVVAYGPSGSGRTATLLGSSAVLPPGG
eukprot:RCo038193